MRRWSPLNDRQVALLRRLGAGAELGSASAERLSAYALRDRGLLAVVRRGGAVRAEVTVAGKFYLGNGRHPEDSPAAVPRGVRARCAGSWVYASPGVPRLRERNTRASQSAGICTMKSVMLGQRLTPWLVTADVPHGSRWPQCLSPRMPVGAEVRGRRRRGLLATDPVPRLRQWRLGLASRC